MGFGSSITANIVSAIIIAVWGWLLSIGLRLPFVFCRRRRLFRFLGLKRDYPRFTVYFSTVFVQAGGACDFRGASRDFNGPALPLYELGVIQPVSSLFRSPVLDGLSQRLRRWLGVRAHWSFAHVLPDFTPSSLRTGDVVRGGGVLTVGSQFYNLAAHHFVQACNPMVGLEDIGRVGRIRVLRGPRQGDVFAPRDGQRDDLAVLEKMYDAATQTTIFFAGGLGVVGTLGAVTYLVNNLQVLARTYGKASFAIVLRFQNVGLDQDCHLKPVELSRFQCE